MGNYNSREEQLQKEALALFQKLSGQKSITKKNLLSLSQKLKELKEIDNEKYRNLSNRLTTLSNNAKGLNLTENLMKFHEIYSDFVECIDVENTITE